MRRITRRTTRKRRSNPIAVFDILGIALIFLCPISLIALCTGDNGILGQYVAAGMRVSLGIGAYIIPFLFALLGAVFVAGPLKLIPRNIGIGSLIVFIDVITWASLRVGPDLETPASGGGYLGNALALVLRKATGDVIGYWVLAAVAIIGAYVILDIPLASLIDRLQGMWQDWREIVRERAPSPKAVKAEPKPAKVAIPKVVEEGRRRTLAGIFGRGRGEEDSEEDSDASVAVAKPVVRINGATAIRRVCLQFCPILRLSALVTPIAWLSNPMARS